MVPPPPKLGILQPRSGWNATSLAFLGDAVWEARVWQIRLSDSSRTCIASSWDMPDVFTTCSETSACVEANDGEYCPDLS